MATRYKTVFTLSHPPETDHLAIDADVPIGRLKLLSGTVGHYSRKFLKRT